MPGTGPWAQGHASGMDMGIGKTLGVYSCNWDYLWGVGVVLWIVGGY